jgi:apolipoprotein N-acyltransferase
LDARTTPVAATPAARAALGAAFVVLFAASFPFRAGDLNFDLGVVCGWLALAPFALMIRGLSPLAAFAWGAGAATLAFSAVLFWIYVVVAVHGGAPAVVAVAAVFGLSAAVAVYCGGAAAMTVAWERDAGRFAFLVLPAAWVVMEHLRGHFPFGGFPWALLGYAAHADGPIRELAALGGVFGLSFLLAAVASLLVRRRWLAAAICLVAAHAAGFVLGTLGAREVQGGSGHQVGLVQGNIPQSVKWDPQFADDAFDVHLEISRLAAAAGDLDLIVWPEASATVPLAAGRYREAISQLARETGASLLVGGVAIEPAFEGAREARDFRFYNSVYAVDGEGRWLDRYDKSQLVPFGEYLPLRPLLGLFLGALATGAAPLDVTPGSGPRPISEIPAYGAADAPAPLICYEIIYPSLVRRAVRRGARILVNVTNDAWYGRTSGPDQFAVIAAMRSAEHGLPMIRVANTGVSAIVAAGGRVLERTPLFERRALVASLPPARSGPTPYTRAGDWVVWVCWLGLAVIGGKSVVGRRRGSRDSGRARGSG